MLDMYKNVVSSVYKFVKCYFSLEGMIELWPSRIEY